MRLLVVAAAFALALAAAPLGAQTETFKTRGLKAPVTLARDSAGIVHISAQNEHDLFFAQGWSVARDRLWQLETWRRRATGTVSEWIGARGLAMDEASRQFRFRGDLQKEMAIYHSHGPAIIQAFVDGINAYIDLTAKEPDRLPPEFGWIGAKPGKWTPAVVISRHNGLFLGGLPGEDALAQVVARIGAAAARPLYDFGPAEPRLEGDPQVDYAKLPHDAIVAPVNALRGALRFQPEDLAPRKRADAGARQWLARANAEAEQIARARRSGDVQQEGSNNWVVSATHTATGKPILANDPHRVIASPSLRYYVHLKAPGWNVIGGGEPSLPGVAIGHNEAGAWGLTIFAIDGEDLLEYETDPANPLRYRYKGAWETMKVVSETFAVKGGDAVTRQLRFTRHGPVIAEDAARHRAWAYRTTMLEAGTAPYLGSLRMDQARSWKEFRDACSFTMAPPENMVWADTSGAIGWQVVGKAPVRTSYSGLLPVRGDGTHEWQGFVPVLELPSAASPAKGFLHSANEMNVPAGYAHVDAVGHDWGDSWRADRIAEVLAPSRRLTVDSMKVLQFDVMTIPARSLVPPLRALRLADPVLAAARDSVVAWDQRMAATSVGAGIYGAYERAMRRRVGELLIPPAARATLTSLELVVVTRWVDGAARADEGTVATRDSIAALALGDAVAELTNQRGPAMSAWTLGGPKGHRAELRSSLAALRDSAQRAQLTMGPISMGGYSSTIWASGNGDLVTDGPSFRLIADLADWERSVGTNTPGQSADPRSKYYRNLFEGWATGRYFPLPFSAARVKDATRELVELRPSRR
ncbi:MAG: penicillin acylase family protein [Gemmatimonadetes bacterium]|nr:penicillin acylase family protein [Gemmatimonadota bacterium]